MLDYKKLLRGGLTALASGLFALTLALALTACGGSNQAQVQEQSSSESKSESSSSASQTQTTQSEPADTRQAFGKKTASSFDVLIKNMLDQPIKSIALRKCGGDPTYQPNLMEATQKFATNEEAHLIAEPLDSADATFDIGVVLEDGRVVEFLNVALDKITSLSLCEADGISYVDYELRDGSKGSTKEAALAAKAEAEAAAQAQAQAEAAAQAQAEAEAAAQAAQAQAEAQAAQAAQAPVEQDYSEPVYVAEPTYAEPTYYEPTYVEPTPEPAPVEAPTQSDESCLGDDIVLRVDG